MTTPTPAEFKPNYRIPCEVCNNIPTIDVYVEGEGECNTGLCGVCTWGEADTIDPENW